MGVRVEGYHLTSQSKKQLIDGLAASLDQESIRFPRIPELVNELKAYEYETTKAGNLRSNAPTGYHDDEVIALALAAHGLGQISVSSRRRPVFVNRGW